MVAGQGWDNTFWTFFTAQALADAIKAVFLNPVLGVPQTVRVFAKTMELGPNKNVGCLTGSKEGAKTWTGF